MTETSIIFSNATSNKPGSLRHPTARAFDAKDWADRLANINNPSERDAALTVSAVWFGQQIGMLRRHTDTILACLGRKDAVMLAVAQLNREYTLLQRRMTRARYEERKQEFVDLQYSSQRLVRTGYPGNELPADDLNDALVDTLPVWLHQSFQCPSGESPNGRGLTQIGIDALRAFTLERSLSKLWQQCLWLDWRFSVQDGRLALAPKDRAAETLRHAWLFRQQAIATQNSFVDLAAEQMAKKANRKPARTRQKTIIALESRGGRKRTFITGHASDRSASHLQRHMWTSVEASYVGMFLDTPLPKLGLSCKQLQGVWYIIADACGVLHRKCSERRLIDASTIREWALICNRSELREKIASCCALSPSDAEAALNFLTYDGSDFRRGVWSMPIVKIPDENTVAMCHSPLEIGNPVRRVEQWLERGELSDQLSGAKRGNRYEAWVRDEIAACLAKNTLLQDVGSISRPIRPADRSIGDIDAAFRIRDLIVVAEVKCLLTPAEPIEQHRYRNKLEDAAQQAIRKATWLSQNLAAHLDDFGLRSAEGIGIVPLVIVNQGYGLSLRIDECLVCDFHTLSCYLRDNEIVIGGAFSGLTASAGYSHETLYRSEVEARQRLLPRIQNAPTLSRYIERTEWAEYLIPCYNPPSNSLTVAGARLSSVARETVSSLIQDIAQTPL